MTNIFGPYGAGINPSESRPSDTGDPGAGDTFFAPCSSPTARDGTVVSYRWLNKILATLRRATRGMGVSDDTASDDLLLEAIKRGATLRNVGVGYDVYQGQDASKQHLIRKLAAGSNVTITEVESPSGEFALRIAAASGGGGGGDTVLVNVGDGADVYKGINLDDEEELRGIKGLAPLAIAVNGDNIDVKLDGTAYTLLLRNANSAGASAFETIISLTNEPSPALADKLLLGKAANGAFRSVSVEALRGSTGLFAKGRIRIRYDGGTGTWELVSTTDVIGGAFSLSGTVTRVLTFTLTTGRSNTVYSVEQRINGAAMTTFVTRANGSASTTLPSTEGYVVNTELDVDLFFFG